jgi:NitT/TauT family transport system permease protein
LEVLRRYWSIALILLAWWGWVVGRGVNRIVAPSPVDVVADIILNFGVYVQPLLETFGLALIGLACGMVVGIITGTLVWLSPLASGLIMPTALVVRVVPMTALVPIVARVLGFGASTTLLIITLLVFFPAFTLTISGLSSPPPGGSDLFRVLGASRSQAVAQLHLPSAIPNIMLALRLAAPLSVGAVLLAQYLMATGGLGQLMRQAHNFGLIEREWGAAILATVLSVIAFGVARALENRVRDRVT